MAIHEAVIQISALKGALIFEPPLTERQQYTISIAGVPCSPTQQELPELKVTRFTNDLQRDSLTTAERTAAALHASGFEAVITNPRDDVGFRRVFTRMLLNSSDSNPK